MMNFEIKKWYIWIVIATAFVLSVLKLILPYIDVIQPSYVMTWEDVEVIFALMIIPLIIGFFMGRSYERDV